MLSAISRAKRRPWATPRSCALPLTARNGMGLTMSPALQGVGAVGVEIVLEPESKCRRFSLDAPGDLAGGKKCDIGDFGEIGRKRAVEVAEVDVDELVFVHAVVQLCPVAREEAQAER